MDVQVLGGTAVSALVSIPCERPTPDVFPVTLIKLVDDEARAAAKELPGLSGPFISEVEIGVEVTP